MANPEHLAKLKEGVEPWNQWRELNPGIRPLLSKAGLSGADFSRANLEGADLSGADLIRANVSGAILTIAILFEAANSAGDFSPPR